MDPISSLRRRRCALLPILALTAAVACGDLAADAATSALQSSAKQKLATCMKAKGFAVRPTHANRATTKYCTAPQACAKKAGLQARGANMQKYILCMAKHGVAFALGKTQPARSSAAYKQANAACASLRA